MKIIIIILINIVWLNACYGRTLEKEYAGFELIGNYYIADENENSHEKFYYLFTQFEADWMSAKSFCSSYHMDLVSLESQHETDYFMNACVGNFNKFGKVSLIGGFYEDEKGWMSTGMSNRLGNKMKINPSEIEVIDKDGKCLSLIKKGNKKFSYGRVACTSKSYAFVCQRMKFKIDQTNYFGFLDIFGK